MNLEKVVKIVEENGIVRNKEETEEDFEFMGLPLEDLKLPFEVKFSNVSCSCDDDWPLEWENDLLDVWLDPDATEIPKDSVDSGAFDSNRFWILFRVEGRYLLYVSTDGKAEAGLILLNPYE